MRTLFARLVNREIDISITEIGGFVYILSVVLEYFLLFRQNFLLLNLHKDFCRILSSVISSCAHAAPHTICRQQNRCAAGGFAVY